MASELGVGFIGAGPVTQAIHLPVIASLGDRLRVVHVMDVDRGVAEAVAARSGARASTEAERVLEDPAVDVVAVCSPHGFHAEQVVAAAAAGKRAVLCEKPLATTADEVRRLADAVRASGTLLVVGAMHTYDPAYTAACEHLLADAGPPGLVRSHVYLPGNDVFVDLSTELVSAAAAPPPAEEGSEVERAAARLRGGVLGLAIHNLPLVRRLCPAFDEVRAATTLEPWGYLLVLASASQTAQLTALMPGRWDPTWSFSAFGDGYELSVAFPPSYVLAGSAVARVTSGGAVREWCFPENGYQVEWRALADAVAGVAELPYSIEDVVDDLVYALEVADGARRRLLAGSGGVR